MLDFIEKHGITKEKLSRLNEIGHCRLTVSLVPDHAKFSLSLSSSDIIILNNLGLDFEISVLCWADVIDEI